MPLSEPIRRRSLQREAAAWDTQRGSGGGAETAPVQLLSTDDVLSDALLLTVDLVDTSGVAVDGTATMVDNVPLEPGHRVLRAFPGGHVDNGIWTVPDPITDPWERYREELLQDGLRVVVTDGAEAADTATAPNVKFGGMRETVWQLATKDPIDPGVAAIDFRQEVIRDGVSFIDNGGGLGIGLVAIPPFPGKIIGFSVFQPYCEGMHITPVFGGAGTSSAEYSGLYYADFSILCSHATTAGVLAVGLFRNGVLEKEIIRRVISTTDERHFGATLVRMVGDDQDTIMFRAYSIGAGFTISVTDVYADIHLVARR